MMSKLYPCKICGKEVPIRSKGLCSWCRQKELPQKHRVYQFKTTQKQRNKKAAKAELMKPYWEHHLENVKGKLCENCGCRLGETIFNVAHILPKAVHKEVMANLNNCIYLCGPFDGRDCHSKFDRTQGRSQVYLMPCFKIALERYESFKLEVKESKYKEIFENYDL